MNIERFRSSRLNGALVTTTSIPAIAGSYASIDAARTAIEALGGAVIDLGGDPVSRSIRVLAGWEFTTFAADGTEITENWHALVSSAGGLTAFPIFTVRALRGSRATGTVLAGTRHASRAIVTSQMDEVIMGDPPVVYSPSADDASAPASTGVALLSIRDVGPVRGLIRVGQINNENSSVGAGCHLTHALWK